ncbi:addiction module protein [Mycolicibacterium austroafricanum]|uniref:addiction module protein n=1 Tax=Mycolicibacterium austroafricanum TaxID=39687 RepID=UPI001F2A167D|nr:addiction module protein [Mycolicibacterium austroafricanum]
MGDVLRRLRRHLADEDDPAARAVEVGLRLVLGYVVIGFVYTVLHIELVDQLENTLSAQFTVFADYAALAVMVLMWPLLLASSWICGIAGCGLIG